MADKIEQIDEKKDAAGVNDDGVNPTKGKAGLPVGNNNNAEPMPTIDPKDGPSSKAQVITYTAQYLQGLDTETAVAFFNKLKAEFSAKDATYGNGHGTWKGASNAGSLAKEDLDLVFASDDSISEDFKTKATTIFEAAVAAAVTVEIARLEEETETKLTEAIASVTEDLTQKVDDHLAHVTEKWMEENKATVEAALRVEAADSFMEGLKALFAEHYVSVPADKVDVVETLTTQVEELEAKINEEVETAIALRKELSTLKAAAVLESALDGLTDSQKDRARKLAEAIDVSDDYAEKVSTIVESVVGSSSTAKPLNEDSLVDPVEPADKKAAIDPVMEIYAQTISRTKKR